MFYIPREESKNENQYLLGSDKNRIGQYSDSTEFDWHISFIFNVIIVGNFYFKVGLTVKKNIFIKVA